MGASWIDEQQRRAVSGAPINPADALGDFDPSYVSDAQLGR
jgi:hypothetical protein